MKAILVTTEHRGVFYAEIDDTADLTSTILSDLRNARMAIYFGTEKGVMQLADTGPTDKSKIGAPADIATLHDVTAIFNVTETARAKWLSA